MIVRPYLVPGNLVVYQPPGRDDIQITVTVRQVLRNGWVVIEYRDGTKRMCRNGEIHPMPESRMKPVASIRMDELVAEYEAMDGDVSSYERLKRKHGVR